MAEETPEVIEEQEPHGESTDYKAMYEKAIAESRKWESRSKANAEKAKKYDELESANKSLEERVSDIEARNKALEEEKAHDEMVKTVASLTGVPESIVSNLSATDEEALIAQAKTIADAYKTPGGAPAIGETGLFPQNIDTKKSAAQQFADALTDAGF